MHFHKDTHAADTQIKSTLHLDEFSPSLFPLHSLLFVCLFWLCGMMVTQSGVEPVPPA